MGMRTTLYGYIEEMDFWRGPVKEKIRQHNTNIINSLPKADRWPPLSCEMFAICENNKEHDVPDLEYSGRIIHFGANLKSVEDEWGQWKLKFENLLKELFFSEARVHFKAEALNLQTFSWRVDVKKCNILHDGSMPFLPKQEYWTYQSTYES